MVVAFYLTPQNLDVNCLHRKLRGKGSAGASSSLFLQTLFAHFLQFHEFLLIVCVSTKYSLFDLFVK